jgi:hypothetical protein
MGLVLQPPTTCMPPRWEEISLIPPEVYNEHPEVEKQVGGVVREAGSPLLLAFKSNTLMSKRNLHGGGALWRRTHWHRPAILVR